MNPNSSAMRSGAGMTEYVVAVLLIAIALVVAVKNFGWRHQDRYLESEIEVETLQE